MNNTRQRRDEMKRNTDIDLAAIPHPKDCHLVPAGATIPVGTPYWFDDHHKNRLTWYGAGAQIDFTVAPGGTFLTVEPITLPVPAPTSSDSPIIVKSANADDFKDGLLAVWLPNENEWHAVGSDGRTHWFKSGRITDWLPAIVTESGHGVWDEHDKRRRVDSSGYTWFWSKRTRTWVGTEIAQSFGSLNALREIYGDGFLVEFADEKGDEE